MVPTCGLLPHVKLCFGTLALFGIQFGILLENLCITGQHQLAVLGDVAVHLVLCGATGSNIGTQEAELLATVAFAAPDLLLGCTIS